MFAKFLFYLPVFYIISEWNNEMWLDFFFLLTMQFWPSVRCDLFSVKYNSHLRDMMHRQLKNSTAVTQEHVLYTNFYTFTLLLGMTLKAHTGVRLWEAFELKKTTNSTYHCFDSCGWTCRQAASSDCSWTWLHSSGPGYREICREKNTALWETQAQKPEWTNENTMYLPLYK